MKKIKHLALLMLIITTVGCQSVSYKPVHDAMSLQNATDYLANNLAAQIKRGWYKDKIVVVKPFSDADSGQLGKSGVELEKLLTQALSRQPGLQAVTLNSSTISEAHYIVSGLLLHESLSGGKKRYKLSASIVDLSSKIVKATEWVWLNPAEISLDPTPFYADIPVVIGKSNVQLQKNILNNELNTALKMPESNYLNASGIFTEAETSYAKNDYASSAELFKRLDSAEGAFQLEGFAGQYITNLKLGRNDQALDGFRQMIEIAADSGNIPVKFKFKSGSDQFVDDPVLRHQYPQWVSIIGDYFNRHPAQCAAIIGHSSVSGRAESNKKLSVKRAMTISRQLQESAAGLKKTVYGFGSEACIRCTKPDDISNAIDRRVEIKIERCS